ncbi:uncharacterized protein M421DRAFT_421863 [Didymella exigua CBS 183.55]|uniref:Celp0028 effector like protein n=1 Tax=Didymella exigua CBS 183.55 TaxID=1150837 RepID=A0A6A5RI24_9PLEO|nr:uncharacterized protein M421DRAFT_421863 [Didymella exigua CBS 183.55]KAF1927452.1 hypothetical protein M421DRAFT_421863 [Didymella exigua CBS 183.55]
MHFSQILALASSAALVAAAPAPVILGVDDIVLYGKGGRFTKMKRDDFEEIRKLRESGIAPPKPSHLDDSLITFSGNETVHARPEDSLKKRDDISLIVPYPNSRFLGWDVPMSQVAKGPATVTIATGYSMTNSIAVAEAVKITLVEDFLDSTTTVTYTASWMTTQTQQFAGTVPDGKIGAIVINAWTNRVSGQVWTGQVGYDGSLSYYQADSFDKKSYGDLSWVDGIIGVCLGDTFPLHRCIGDGTL